MSFLKHPIKAVPLALALTLALAAMQATAQPVPLPLLSGVSFVGSGCPSGSTGVAIDPSGAFLNIQFAQFKIPASAPPASQTKGCTLKLNLQAPLGMEMSIDKAIYIADAAPVGLVNAAFDAYTRFSVLTPVTKNQVITNAGPTTIISNMGSGWSGCTAPAPLEDRLALKLTPVAGKPNAAIELKGANYSLKYRACVPPPVSNFTFILSGSTATGWTAAGTCNEGHKIKIKAKHSSYVPGSGKPTPPVSAAEFESNCGGTNIIPPTPKTLPYAWAGPLPPSNVFGNVVFSNSPPLPMPPNSFMPGMWAFEASQVEATPANPTWPRTVIKPPPVLVN